MDAKETTQEKISAFADGEASEQHAEIALAALRAPERRADWELYHRIGDVLRSSDMDVTLSPGFAAKMAARLDAEPPILAPAPTGMPVPAKRHLKRYLVPSMVATAAIATVAFVTAPHLLVASKQNPPVMAATIAPSEQAVSGKLEHNPAGTQEKPMMTASGPEGVVVRDARIDDYLLAHQRFSPSVYSTAQYARSATFATDSDK